MNADWVAQLLRALTQNKGHDVSPVERGRIDPAAGVFRIYDSGKAYRVTVEEEGKTDGTA